MPNTQLNKLMASVNIDWKQTLPDETSANLSPMDASTFGAIAKITQGTGYAQADMILRDVYTLAAASNLNVLPENANNNALGESLTMAKIKLIWVRNRSTHISGGEPRLTIGGSLIDEVSEATSVLYDIRPGGFYCYYSPEGTVLPVDATLQFINCSATDPVELEYLLAGTD